MFVPLAVIAEHLLHSATLAFISACLGIVPLAKLMGDATEKIAHRVGGAVAGMMNSALGNLAELIIAIMALLKGQITVLKASLTGAIVANILLVMGCSAFFGGLKREEQSFNKAAVSASASLLFIVTIALLIPSMAVSQAQLAHAAQPVSVATALVLLGMFVASCLFSLKTHAHIYEESQPEAQSNSHAEPLGKSLVILIGSSLLIALLAEILTGTIDQASKRLGLSEIFIGMVIVAIVGNAAEHSVAVLFALKNKMNLSVNIALESSKQIATFVVPFLVILGWFINRPFDLVFTTLEVISLLASVFILNLICLDGKTNWLEGLSMIGMYAILGVAFYFF